MRNATFQLVLWISSVLLLLPEPVGGQDVTVTDSLPQCDECLTVERMFELRGLPDSISIGTFPKVINSGSHFFLISRAGSKGRILLFSRQGKFLKDLAHTQAAPAGIGRFWYIGRSRGDSVLVGEMGRRLHVISEEGVWGRTILMETPGQSVAQFPDGVLVVSGQVPTRSEIGRPLHLMGPSGDRRGALGSQMAIFPHRQMAGARIIALASDSSVFATRPDHFSLEEWSKNGTLIRTLHREADWFPPPDDQLPRPNPSEKPPDPAIADMIVDREDLWIVALVPPLDWKAYPRRSSTGKVVVTPEYMNRQFDTRIEVIDLRTGTLTALAHFDECVQGFTAPGEVYTVREDAEGRVHVGIWTIALRMPPPRSGP